MFIYLAGAVCGTVRAALFSLAGQRLVARLRKQLFNNVIIQEVAFFDTTRCREQADVTTVMKSY